jgi:hypothetical protein
LPGAPYRAAVALANAHAFRNLAFRRQCPNLDGVNTMANVVQPSAKKLFMDGDIDLLADTIKVYLIDLSDYTYSTAHAFLSDIPAAARVASATLTTKTTTGGVFDAADSTFPSVSGDISEALAIVKDTGTEATSPYITFIDSGVGGFPITPQGTQVLITWNPSGIFGL